MPFDPKSIAWTGYWRAPYSGSPFVSALGTPIAGFYVDFSTLALGGMSAASFASATGLTFSRSTVSTVQTSDSTIDSSPAINAACIGDRTTGGSRGLVIQHNTRNALAGNPRDLTAGWATGTATTTAAFAAGPDGSTAATRTNVTAGQYAPYGSVLTSARYCFSSWQRSTSATNGTMQQGWLTAAPGDGIQVRRAQTTTWGRLALPNGAVSRQYFDVSDGRDYSGSGGDAAVARDVLVDFMQREAGDFPTEAVTTSNAYRANDVLSIASGSSIVTASSRVRFYAQIIPKFASTSQVFYDGSTSGGPAASAAWYLFSWGANGQNYAKILDADKKLYVKIANGTEAVSTNAVSFLSTDVVEFDIEVGNSVASVARYRKNGGGWIDLVLSTISNVPAPLAGVGILYNDFGTAGSDSGQFPCWLQRVAFLTDADVVPLGSGENLVGNTSPPSVGPALNGKTSASYNGTSSFLASTKDTTTFIGVASTAYSVSGVLMARSASAPNVGTAYSDAAILADSTNGFFYLTFTTRGITVGHYDGVSFKEVTGACPADSLPHTFHAYFNNPNLNITIDGVAATTVSSVSNTFGTPFGALTSGKNYAGAKFFDGALWEIGISNTDIGATARTNLESYFQTTYIIPLGPVVGRSNAVVSATGTGTALAAVLLAGFTSATIGSYATLTFRNLLLKNVYAKHEQRVRLLFTGDLAAGAFGTNPTLYTIKNQDGLGTDPAVSAAMIVSGSPAVVELALSTPLVNGALYRLYAERVPGRDGSVTDIGAFEPLRLGTVTTVQNVEPGASDLQRLLYGVDLLWNGKDYQENSVGDLDRVSGPANVSKALNRRVQSEGLPYDPEYGAHVREYVDSPVGVAGTMTGSIQAQILRDPRVKSVTTTFETVDATTYIHAHPKLVSGEDIARVSLTVPNAS